MLTVVMIINFCLLIFSTMQATSSTTVASEPDQSAGRQGRALGITFGVLLVLALIIAVIVAVILIIYLSRKGSIGTLSYSQKRRQVNATTNQTKQ